MTIVDFYQSQWELAKKIFFEKKNLSVLFSGQENLGKEDFAKELVKFLSCNQKGNFPCQQCFNCRAIEKENFPDLLILRPEKKEIQISQIRELQAFLSLSPQLGNSKIAIIVQAELMNLSSQNCLLKTLEEPKGKNSLILITAFPEMLKDTILSRVQILRFFPCSPKIVKSFLMKKTSPKVAEKIIFLSGFKPKKILEFLRDRSLLEREFKKYELIEKIFGLPFEERIIFIEKLFQEKKDILEGTEFLDKMIRFLRYSLLKKIDLKTKDFLPYLKKVPPKELVETIKKAENLRKLVLNYNLDKRLAFENLFFNLHF